MRAVVAAALVTCCCMAHAGPLAVWDVTPELGAGTTLFHGVQATVTLGLKLGTTTADFPVIPNREFGVAAVQIGDVTGLSGWFGLAKIGTLKVRLGGIAWKDETSKRPTGDLLIYGAREFTFGW